MLQRPAGDEQELGTGVPEGQERLELRGVVERRSIALERGNQHRFLRWEMPVKAPGAGCEPGRTLDLANGRLAVARVGEEPKCSVEQSLARVLDLRSTIRR